MEKIISLKTVCPFIHIKTFVYTFLKVNAIFKIINPELYFKDLLYDREARKVLPFFLQYLARAELF